MWIVSQTKCTMVNSDKVVAFDLNNGVSVVVDYGAPNDSFYTIGKYKSEERAKEVLKELLSVLLTQFITGTKFEMPKE